MPGNTLFSIGEALIDMIPSRVGCTFDEVPSFSPRTGGAPANVCAAFARLGGASSFLTQLGDDPFGHKIARELEACGIDLSHLVFTDKANTALAFVSLEEDGNRTFSFYRKPSADLLYAPEQIDLAWFRDAFALHFCSVSLVDSPMRHAHLAAIGAAREAGAIVSFDPNLRFPLWPDREMLRQTVLQFLPLSNILKVSDEELEFLTGTADIEAALPQLFAGDVQLVLYTCGSKGAYAYTRAAHAFAPCQKVRAVDSTVPSTATPPCPRWASDSLASCARSGLCRRNGRFRFPHCNIAFQYNRRNLFLHSCFLPAGLWWAGRCVTIESTDRRFFMPFEFAFLDWLQQFHNPVLDALAVFLNYAGERGEIWIAFTLLLLLFRRTRKAGCAMATALVLYLVAGDCILKPLFARPRPCDVNTAITILVKRPHGHSFPSGHTASAFAAAFALWLQNRKLGVPALVLAAFIAFTRLYLYVHFPTDVLGGLVLGIALGFFASWLVDSLANKSKKKQSV